VTQASFESLSLWQSFSPDLPTVTQHKYPLSLSLTPCGQCHKQPHRHKAPIGHNAPQSTKASPPTVARNCHRVPGCHANSGLCHMAQQTSTERCGARVAATKRLSTAAIRALGLRPHPYPLGPNMANLHLVQRAIVAARALWPKVSPSAHTHCCICSPLTRWCRGR